VIASCFQKEVVELPDRATIPDQLPHLDKLPYKRQQYVWSKVGSLTAAIRKEMKEEMTKDDCIPNQWMQLIRSRQVRSLTAAAEKYHRKHLRRQMRSISYESSSSAEFISYRPPLHPDSVLCNAIIPCSTISQTERFTSNPNF